MAVRPVPVSRRRASRAPLSARWGRRTARLARDDAVHLDFQPDNVLADGGVPTGVVDWDGAGRGDRRLDLVTLRFGLAGRAGRNVVARLDAILDDLPLAVLRPAWAHMSLRMVDWMIRHHDDDLVDAWLTVAESGMRR
jgi:aminoglycoside phosphotransferase (APT) family kinase protein